MGQGQDHTQRSGLPAAIATYAIWGLLPLYLRQVHEVPPIEFVGWRVLFTLPFCLLLVAILRSEPALRAAFAWRTLRLLLISALLIGVNWTIYIVAVQSGHVIATAIGYYINPLTTILAGTLFLGERLSQRQWLAVGLALGGVSLLAWDAFDTLWISLSLALTFTTYGVVRKLAPVESLAGLSVETLLLMPAALVLVGWYALSPAGSALGGDPGFTLLIALSGVVTGVPLLLFTYAARRMDYSTLGMMQFFSPTIAFLLGIYLFGESLKTSQLACLMLIWAAIVVFMWDLWVQRRLRLAQEAPA